MYLCMTELGSFSASAQNKHFANLTSGKLQCDQQAGPNQDFWGRSQSWQAVCADQPIYIRNSVDRSKCIIYCMFIFQILTSTVICLLIVTGYITLRLPIKSFSDLTPMQLRSSTSHSMLIAWGPRPQNRHTTLPAFAESSSLAKCLKIKNSVYIFILGCLKLKRLKL